MGGHKGLCGVFCVLARARVGSGRQGEGQGAAVSLQGMSPSRLLQVFPGGSSACPGLGRVYGSRSGCGVFLPENARAPPALKGSRAMERSRAELLPSIDLWRACGELPPEPEAAPLGEARAAPEPCRHMAVPARPWWHSSSLPSPRGHSRLSPAGNVPAVPVSRVLSQLFTLNSTNSHFQTRQKEDARCDTCGGENGRLFLWNRWGFLSSVLFVGTSWAGSPREQKAGAQPGETPWSRGTPGIRKAPCGSRGHSPELLGDTLCCPPGAGPLLQPVPAAAGKAAAQLGVLLLQPCTAASPGPAPRALPCALPAASPRAGTAPAFPGQEGSWEASLWGQRAVGLCCELSSCPRASVSPVWRVTGDTHLLQGTGRMSCVSAREELGIIKHRKCWLLGSSREQC